MPRARPIELPAAMLLATAALAFSVAGACAVLLSGLVLLAGDAEVALRAGWPTWCAGAALGCANVAGVLALTRRAGGLHPAALAAAWLLGFAAPVSGAPLPAALLAAAGTGLAIRLGARPGPRHAAPLASAWGIAAAALLVLAFAAPASERAALDSAPARIAHGTAPDRAASTPLPDAVPAVPDRMAPAPAVAVRAYYAALDRRDFARAWTRLSPTVRAGFGGFDRWRDGFATTVSSRPAAVRTIGAGAERVVAVTLVARDRAPCGVLVRRFDVRWRLRRAGGGWRAAALSGAPAGAPACAAR